MAKPLPTVKATPSHNATQRIRVNKISEKSTAAQTNERARLAGPNIRVRVDQRVIHKKMVLTDDQSEWMMMMMTMMKKREKEAKERKQRAV